VSQKVENLGELLRISPKVRPYQLPPPNFNERTWFMDEEMTQKEIEELDFLMAGFLRSEERLLIIKAMEKAGYRKLMPLDEQELFDLAVETKVAFVFDFVKAICAKYGHPKRLREEEIENIILTTNNTEGGLVDLKNGKPVYIAIGDIKAIAKALFDAQKG
jgi:hypothetical protein